MTVQKAIERVNALRPNAYDEEQKFAWLSELDGRIKTEIFDAHEDFEDVSVPVYILGNRTDELFVPEPYSDIYMYWLFMKMDFMNGEFDRFNNDAMMYNTAWLAFSNYINRTHTIKKRTKIENL